MNFSLIRPTDEQIKYFYQVANLITETEEFFKTKNYKAHGKVSVYEHSISVAKASFIYATQHEAKVDLCSLIRGALLHDYYLYDWHKNPPFTFHGLKHPKISLKNASRDFQINKIEADIIRNHMFPLTIFHFPKSKEAKIVSKIDKKISFRETKGKPYEFTF